MARSIIGSLWNPAQRNELNRMLSELYEGINTASGTKSKIDAFLEGAGVVSSKMLVDGSVTNTKLGTRSVTWDKLDEGAVTGSRIADGAVGARHVLDDTVTNSKIQDGAVSGSKIEDGAVSNSKLGLRSITWDKFDDGAVTYSKIRDDAVVSDKIRDGAVTNSKIEDGAVTNTKIVDRAIHNRNIADLAVKENNIAGLSVTEIKLASNSVTGAKMADSSIVNRHLSDRIVHTRNIGDFQITREKLASDSVDEGRIIDSSVSTSKIQDGAITEEKIADGVLDKVSNFDQVTINNGKTYPLKNVSRDGQIYEVSDEVKNTVLDVKVHGAEKGKYYVLMYVANGLNGSYGFTIGEYDIGADGGFEHSSRTTLATYNNGGNFSDEPTSDIVHRTLNIPDKSLTFDIIYDRTAINVYPLGLDINNTQAGKAIGTVIHPNNYIYSQNVSNAPDGIERTNNKVFMDKKADRFTIYTLKSNGNYIGIEIRHQTKGIENSASSNFDLWLVRTIKEYSRTGNGFTTVRSIIDDSVVTTMDLMIKESSEMDYMGGINHGDEINDFAMLLVDGKPIDLSATGFYEAKEIRLIQRNKLYRDTVYTSGVLEHLGTVGKEHVFNYEDGYTLHNRVSWHESINIVESYLGSLSLYREDEKGNSPLWHTVISDITHTPYDLKTVGGQMSAETDVDRVILLGENLSCTVEIDRFKNVTGNKIHVANFAEKYSKLYISYVPTDYTTTTDEIWKQSTKFNFELGD